MHAMQIEAMYSMLAESYNCARFLVLLYHVAVAQLAATQP
jgi:hypothetical protein